MIRAIVFDFDGLILDTEEPVYRSWLEVYEEHGEELPFDKWVQIVGSTNSAFHPQSHLEERLGRPLTQEVLERRTDRRTQLVLAQKVLPGVTQHITAAREAGLKLGVASSSSGDWVRGHLGRLGLLELFACVRCRDDVADAKPAPDLYLAVLECLGVDAREGLAIEDSPHGIAAAKTAGMWCVAVPNSITRGLDFSQADLVLGSLADVALPELLKRFETA